MTTPDSAATEAAATDTQPATGTSASLAAEPATTSAASAPSDTDSLDVPVPSSRSGKRSTSSMPHFDPPEDVRTLAAQVANVATHVLNGDLDDDVLDRIRLYSSLTRTTQGLVNSDVTKSRFLKEEPNLSLKLNDE